MSRTTPKGKSVPTNRRKATEALETQHAPLGYRDLFERSGVCIPDSTWTLMASPKPQKVDKDRLRGWVNFYASFSWQFAEESLRLMSNSKPSVILDPFCGTGTTLKVATMLGHRGIGLELDPFSALFARSRIATSPNIEAAKSIISQASKIGTIAPRSLSTASSYLSRPNLAVASQILHAVETRLKSPLSACLKKIISFQGEKYDTELFILTALASATNRLAAVSRGSNPVWLRQISEEQISDQFSIADETLAAIQHLTHLSEPKSIQGSGVVHWCDARRMDLPSESVDIILSSPPYLNRLDYVAGHYPAIGLISDVIGQDMEALRRSMIGTTKINTKEKTLDELGEQCKQTLERIWLHNSLASQRYYYWTYLQYFLGMSAVLREMMRVLRLGGRGALVLQDSYYKDIRIPIAEIMIEMITKIGLVARVVREQVVRSHMGQLSPQQRKRVPVKILKEYVLYFEKRAPLS